MKAILPLVLTAAVLVTGCRRKSALPPPAPAQEPAAESTAAATTESAPAADPKERATEAAPETTEKPAPPPEVTAMAYSDAAGLTLIVQQFYDKHGRVPRDFNELVAEKMLFQVPKARPGFRYVIDPRGRQVLVVRQ
jgi:hypothetical protein